MAKKRLDSRKARAAVGSKVIARPQNLRVAKCHPYVKPRDSTTPDQSWTVPDLCAQYAWPTKTAGGGVIAIVELGGGWVQADMDAFFASIKQPKPTIVDVPLDLKNSPNQSVGSSQDADGEVALDIQIAAAGYYVATGKPASIRVYWCQSISAGVRAATADGCDVCSISWGADEADWGAAALTDMEDAATAATAAGMIVFAASGDNNSADGGKTPANVDAPASCPHVVGCGGTKKTPTAETVWNWNPGDTTGTGTGGGYSTFFASQPFQAGVSGPGRMVPDVSADADPNTGYKIVVHGAPVVLGGTSAVAPLYAGLFAALGRKLGFISPTLWKNQACFNDIVTGDNGYFRAAVGPDPCTGIGSPIGTRIARLFDSGAVLAPHFALPPIAQASTAPTGSFTGTIELTYVDGSLKQVSTTPGR